MSDRKGYQNAGGMMCERNALASQRSHSLTTPQPKVGSVSTINSSSWLNLQLNANAQ
eukprot:m.369474 g.369474  ORF g.369474 m.369474 type:complete len:57 (-) comp49536_c0_seq1:106-276(-)